MVGLLTNLISIRENKARKKAFEDVSTIACIIFIILTLFPQRCQVSITHLNICLHIYLYQAPFFEHNQLVHEMHSSVLEKGHVNTCEQKSKKERHSGELNVGSCVWNSLVTPTLKMTERNRELRPLFHLLL